MRLIKSYGIRQALSDTLKIYLIEAGKRILPALPERISQAVHRGLVKLGIEVLIRSPVQQVTEAGVVLADDDDVLSRAARGNACATEGAGCSPTSETLDQEPGTETSREAGAEVRVSRLRNIGVVGLTQRGRHVDGQPFRGNVRGGNARTPGLPVAVSDAPGRVAWQTARALEDAG